MQKKFLRLGRLLLPSDFQCRPQISGMRCEDAKRERQRERQARRRQQLRERQCNARWRRRNGLVPYRIDADEHAPRRSSGPRRRHRPRRHEFACARSLIAAGVDIATISKRLGHARASVTVAIYAHMLSSDDGKAPQSCPLSGKPDIEPTSP